MFDNIAVCVKNVQKNYGSIEILRKICVTVERGTIYGLLGPSGCGKTTLLNCIVGRSKIDDGDIWFLGKKAGDSPGSQVGYMPQNTALINKFTVKEVIYFFGKIFDMDCYVLRNRFKKLKLMLDLPPDNRIISKCSGGQQRRVSLAVALIHDPELLILDEPSVGADPILRDRIWTYLYQLVYEARRTVIITTHYIEEAKQANRIGLMRGGKLLVEDSPVSLMRTYNCSTLEDIFFILSQREEEKTGGKIMIAENETSFQFSGDSTENLDFHASSDKILPEKKSTKNSLVSMKRVKVLLRKNVKLLQRNRIGVCVLLTMPFIQMLLFMIAVGREVHDIPIAVVNDEVRNFSCSDISWNNTVLFQNNICHLEHISCRFLDFLKHPVMQLKSYDTTNKAIDDIRKGKLAGVIHIASNLSERFKSRLSEEAEVEVTAQSDIEVFLDMADVQIGNTVRSRLTDMYLNFQTSIFNDCNVSQLGRPTLAFLEYYYGHKDDQLIIFMAPGLSMMIIFFMGVMTAASIIIDEKIEGIWDRSIVAGITTLELTIAHFTVQIFLLLIMTVCIILVVFVIHQYEHVASIWIIFTFIYLQGLCGLVFGFWVSVLSTNHTMANVIITGIMNPLTIISGIFWPLEAMPYALQIISRCTPLTIPIEAFRNIVKKGWDLSNKEGYFALGILTTWIMITALMSLYMIKVKR